LLKYSDFCDFPDGKIVTVIPLKEANMQHRDLPYQISSKLFERLWRYCDLTVFQNGGCPPPWICWAQN